MRVSALCCECGNVRQTSTWQGWGEVCDDWDIFDRYGYERCLVWRKCAVCARVTSHAYLRADDDRDELERLLVEVDTMRTADDIVAQLQVEHALERLPDLKVAVVWDDMIVVNQVGGVLRHRIGDGTFVLVLAPGQEARTLALVLEQVLRVLECPGASAVWHVVPTGLSVEPGAFCVFELPKVGVRW